MPERMDLETRLARLAPTVDEAAARDVFERRRRAQPVARWLLTAAVIALVVAGVVALAVVRGDDPESAIVPVDTPVPSEPDSELRPAPGDVVIAGENFFDVITVAETTVGFGNAQLVTSGDELASLWAEWNPGVDAPTVEFGDMVALVMTRPDNACADVVTRFEVSGLDTTPVWTPVFEELSPACEDPLLSWLYVVAIERSALGDEARIRVPAADAFGLTEQIIVYAAPAGSGQQSADPAPVTLTPTGVVVAVPPVGQPALHNTSIGLFYVVQHDGGEVSVVPATIDRRSTEDDGVTMLRRLVVPSSSGGSFASGGDIWDAWGRALTAGRSSDLVGYAAQVVGDEVEVLYSDATRLDGDPQVPDGESYPNSPELWEPITPVEFLTLSSSGPIWRLFDAQLVVEDGIGRICRIETRVSVDQLDRCDSADTVLDTLVTSTNPDITTWYESPILALQDPIRGFTHVIPLGGSSSLNDALSAATDG